MGFFDRVKDALTTLSTKRAENARKAAQKAQDQADAAGREAAEKEAAAKQEQAAEKDAGREETGHEAMKGHRTYTVRSGDTLPGIADKHGVDWREMATLNRIDNPDLIYPGQVFKIPND